MRFDLLEPFTVFRFANGKQAYEFKGYYKGRFYYRSIQYPFKAYSLHPDQKGYKAIVTVITKRHTGKLNIKLNTNNLSIKKLLADETK